MAVILICSLKTTHEPKKEKTPSGNSVSSRDGRSTERGTLPLATTLYHAGFPIARLKSASRKVKKRVLFCVM